MKKTLTLVITLIGSIAFAQNETKNVLFLGNSYTSANNLPQMVEDIALSMGDTLIWDIAAPGVYYLDDHLLSSTSLNKIKSGNWDYVTLQEQSQAPTLPDSWMPRVFENARKLDSIINTYNVCVETVFYMTWGRKNGDPAYCAVFSTWPYVCTYSGMDSLLNLRYRIMAENNNAIVSPAGAVWNYIRKNHPLIELYQADESHPTVAGTYAAACCFYTAFFRKDPALTSFNPGLSATDAATIRNASKIIVYDSLLNWHIGEYDSIQDINCSTASVMEKSQNSFWEIFPNPASETLTVRFADNDSKEPIQIYTTLGVLIQEIEAFRTTRINIVDLPKGLYYIQLKNNNHRTLKFIKE